METQNNFAIGSIPKHIMSIAGPMIVAQLINVLYNEKLKNVPKILETPYIEEYPPYKLEIEMILTKKFNPNLYEDVKTI